MTRYFLAAAYWHRGGISLSLFNTKDNKNGKEKRTKDSLICDKRYY